MRFLCKGAICRGKSVGSILWEGVGRGPILVGRVYKREYPWGMCELSSN